jgi:hypothetical protein
MHSSLRLCHKDKNGAAIRTDEKNYNSFKTRKGRSVLMVAAFYRTYNWKKRKQVLLQMHY